MVLGHFSVSEKGGRVFLRRWRFVGFLTFWGGGFCVVVLGGYCDKFFCF